MDYEFLDKIANKLYSDLIESEDINKDVQVANSVFYIEDKYVEASYSFSLVAYDFMVISGTITNLELSVDGDPMLLFEESYIQKKIKF